MLSSLPNSNVSYGPYIFSKPNIESSLFTKKNPFLHDFLPPKNIEFLMLKKQKPLILKSSIKDLVKTSAVFQAFQSVSNLIAFKRFLGDFSLFKEEDLIQLNHNGNCIVGVVQHIGFLETTLIGPTGLIILHNSRIDKFSIINLTKIVWNEKLFGFHTLFDCKTNLKFYIKGIESVLEKDENVKDNSTYNLVTIQLPTDKIQVVCYVNCLKLQIPQFRSYLQVRGQVLADIERFINRNTKML
ncbi:hypothetical protein MKW92_023221 [Papaver armeniacum]|nr:hypothetical protein MKW92_023221 [Papaver armeniacum]